MKTSDSLLSLTMKVNLYLTLLNKDSIDDDVISPVHLHVRQESMSAEGSGVLHLAMYESSVWSSLGKE